MKSNRLGKGLEALIPQLSPDEDASRKDLLFEIEVTRVHRNPNQPRMEFDTEALEGLKQSIRENGVIQPITVRRIDEGYELIAGERRLRAVQDLGYKKIPAFVMEVKSEDQMLELALVENIQREDLNPMEMAKAFDRLQKEYGLTQEQVAMKVGKDRATVANFIRLLKLPRQVQESLQKREIDMGHARALMGLTSPSEILMLLARTVKQQYSVRKVEECVRAVLAGDSRKPKVRKSEVHYSEIEERLRSLLGTQVRVTSSGKGGRIEISFYSDDDLDRILERLDTINP